MVAAGLGLVVSGLAFLLSRTFWDSYDATIMGQVALRIVYHHTVTVPFDPYHLNSPHSFYGIGMSLLMIPGIEISRLFGGSAISGAMATNAWLLGVLAVVVYVWSRLRNLSVSSAVAVGAIVAVGGGLFAYASTGMAEVGLADSVALGLLGLSAMRTGRGWGPWLVGAAAGAAAVMRDDSVALVVPWLVIGALLADRRWVPTALRVVGGALPFLVLWTWYNDDRYGAPWRVGYNSVVKLDHPFFTGLYGLLLSPGRGLLWYAPVIVVALVALPSAWRRDRVLVSVAGALLLSRVLFYAGYWGWYGGGNFGPRYLLPAVPVIAVGLMEAIPRLGAWRPPWRALALLVALASMAVGVTGAAVRYQSDSLEATLARQPDLRLPTSSAKAFLDDLESSRTQSTVDHYMFQWSLFPVTNEASMLVHRDDLASAGLGRPADKLRDVLSALIMAAGLVALGWGWRAGRRRPGRAAGP
jgi:hypothetical protein